jgi:hypothetical protein
MPPGIPKHQKSIEALMKSYEALLEKLEYITGKDPTSTESLKDHRVNKEIRYWFEHYGTVRPQPHDFSSL